MAADTDVAAAPPLCTRCKEQDGVLDLRSKPVCRTCFTNFVFNKAIKRLEVLQRETKASSSSSSRPSASASSRPPRYLLALSRGPSSTALLHILDANIRRQRERNQRPRYELVIAFVDIDIDIDDDVSQNNEGKDKAEDPFTTHFPDLTIQKIPLSRIFSSSAAIDWSSLPLPPFPDGESDSSETHKLRTLLTTLPTTSARSDVSRQLTRQLILAEAATKFDCDVVLLGHTTTSLAELTLSEAAKGRGVGIPWLVNDGAFPLPLPSSAPTPLPTDDGDRLGSDGNGEDSGEGDKKRGRRSEIHVYSPLREIFRNEIRTYISLARTPGGGGGGSLADLVRDGLGEDDSGGKKQQKAVVSHRDLSLDDVVARYFVDVEAQYPSVVANVVRTTGKLSRHVPVPVPVVNGEEGHHHRHRHEQPDGEKLPCGLCGVRLDPLGDERWKGEIGESDAEGSSGGGGSSRLCYGCERSVRG